MASVHLALVLLFLTPTLISAQSASISQDFTTTDKVAEGALMSLDSTNPGNVELAGINNSNQLVGVVGTNPLLELGGSGNVQIVTSGITAVLVSDIAGDIKTGDKITTSPLVGVGQKATTTGVMVVGTAQTDLASADTTEHFITDKEGTVQTVRTGLISAQIDVIIYANDSTYVPAFVQQFANTVAGKPVGIVQLIITALILLLAFTSVAVMLYASVKSSIISIGRNPLSEHSVRKSLWQAGFTTLGILAATIVIVLLILRI